MEPRNLLAFGTGVGIAVGPRDLAVSMARVRPTGVRLLGTATISDFRERPAAEWGAEYRAFVKQHGGGHLTAAVLLPRREIIVRQIALAGVANKDMAAALSFQIDTLHPWGDDDVAFGWARLGKGDGVLIGIVKRATLERYMTLFAEAGIPISAVTFSAAALYSASRLFERPFKDGFVAAGPLGEDGVEIYGESEAKPVFSAEFDLPIEQAKALAASELRLPADIEPVLFSDLLPRPSNAETDGALPYATALTGACPHLATIANLLPPESRSTNSRALYIPTAVLAVLLLVVAGALLAYPAYADRQYLQALEAETARVETQARKVSSMDRDVDKIRARSRLLDEFRSRSKADLDALNELTRILPPPIWTNSIELSRDSVLLGGEAEQAAPLLRLIDASPYFQNSEFASSITKAGPVEVFRIRAARETVSPR